MPHPRPRPGILEIEPYVGGKSHAHSDQPVAKLSSNENALGPSQLAVEAFQAEATKLHRYPDGNCTALRAALARRHNLDPDTIVCGAGSDELIALVVRAFAGPGDEVLYSAHGFLMYKLAALAAGAHPVVAPERDVRADVDGLLKAVTSRTRLVFIANPNNPTGSYLSGAELERLRAGLPHDVVLVVDAAYAEFVSAADYSSGLELATTLPNTIMTRTFSKLYGLASLRIGWMTSSRHVADIVNRVRGPFNVSQAAQAAALAALEDLDHQERSRRHNEEWLAWLAREIDAVGFHVYPSVGNFVLVRFPSTPGRTAEDAADWLEREGILPRMMHAYGLPDCLRLSIGLEVENRRMVAALEAFAKGATAA